MIQFITHDDIRQTFVSYQLIESCKECFVGTLQIRKYYSSYQNGEKFSRIYVVRKRFEHKYVAARSTRFTFLQLFSTKLSAVYPISNIFMGFGPKTDPSHDQNRNARRGNFYFCVKLLSIACPRR